MATLQVTAQNLVMRSGPGRNCLRRRTLREGHLLSGLSREIVFAEGANWIAIETADGARGWVNQQFVRAEPGPGEVLDA